MEITTEKIVDIHELAEDVGRTRQNVNYHLLLGRGGNVGKDGMSRTHRLIITPINALQFIEWMLAHGRMVNHNLLLKSQKKYSEMVYGS